MRLTKYIVLSITYNSLIMFNQMYLILFFIFRYMCIYSKQYFSIKPNIDTKILQTIDMLLNVKLSAQVFNALGNTNGKSSQEEER